MKRNVIIFGLILGTILAGNMVYMTGKVYNDENFQSNDIIGYAAMIVIFSLTFFGIRNYRDRALNGTISLGQAFKTGALIAVIGATMYVVTWLFYYYLFVPDFIDKYTACVLKEANRGGASVVELNAKREEMAQFKEMYKSPLFVVLITYAEVLPIGLIVAFISSLILKRKSVTKTDK
jgi:small-conductance mechanosensitive channel